MIGTRSWGTAFGFTGLSAGLLACALALAPAPAEAILVARPTLPDALTAADSARGVVLATCIRGSTEALPALFRVESRLGGAVPDTFTAYPPFGIPRGGVPLRAGYRYALLLRDVPPPAGPVAERMMLL